MVSTSIVPCPLEALPCPAALTDSKLCVTASNSGFLECWAASGADTQLLPGAPVALLCRPGARSRFQRELSRHCADSPQPFSLTLRTPPLLMQLTPIDVGAGAGWLVTVRDVSTASRRSTNRLLVASLVHDLKMPVQTVLGWVSLLRKKRVDGAQLEAVLGILERNARLEADLLNELLEVAGVRGTTPTRRPARVDLAELVRSMTDALRPLAEESGIQLRAHGAATPVFVSGDAQDFTRILGNLIANAIKFSEPGGTVESQLSLEKSSVRLVVRDHGRGIGAGFLPYVFDSFRRERRSQPGVPDGIGIGLATVHHLVRLHGGVVRAESGGPGQGSTFTVMLPRPSARARSIVRPATGAAC
jgi:signal transduction histidine kinase